MKKLFAIVLAGVITFALASPAMAAGQYTVGLADVNDCTVSDATANAGDTVYITTLPESGKETDHVYVGADNPLVSVTVSKESENYYSFVMPSCGVVISVVFKTKTYPITEINATFTPSVGDQIFYTYPTITSTTPATSSKYDVEAKIDYALKVPAGENPDNYKMDYANYLLKGSSPDAVYEEGYDYYINLTFDANSVYVFPDQGFTVIINGIEDENFEKDLDDITDKYYKVTPASTTEETPAPTTTPPTTPAPTTTPPTTTAPTTTAPTTTAAATTPQTGDASNMTLAIVVFIVLAACAGVTIFATKKSR